MLKCTKCGTSMKLRIGKFGEFYYCPKSPRDLPHGTISKATVDEYLTLRLRDVAKVAQEDDRIFLKHVEHLENNFEVNPKTIFDFFNDHSMKEDMEEDLFWADVIPRG